MNFPSVENRMWRGPPPGTDCPTPCSVIAGFFSVHFIDNDLIEAKVWYQGIFAIGRESCPMGVGRILSSVHHLGSALVFRDGGFPKFSICIKWKQGNRTASVLSGEEKFSTWMNGDVGTSAIRADHPGEFGKFTVFTDVISQCT